MGRTGGWVHIKHMALGHVDARVGHSVPAQRPPSEMRHTEEAGVHFGHLQVPPDSREKMCRNRWHKAPEIQEGGHAGSCWHLKRSKWMNTFWAVL